MAINYTKINNGAGWDTTSYVNPTNLNHMESGIKSACDGVDSITADYSKKCEMDELKYLGWVTPREYTGTRSSTNDSGVFIQRVGRVDLGSLSWDRYQFGSINAFYANISDRKALSYAYQTKYTFSNVYVEGLADKSITTVSNGTYIYIRDDSYTDSTQFRNSLSGTYLYYELASPVEWTEGSENYVKVKSYTYTTTVEATTNFSSAWLHGFDLSDIPSTAKILTKTVKSNWAWAMPSVTTEQGNTTYITWCCFTGGTQTVTFTLDVLYI